MLGCVRKCIVKVLTWTYTGPLQYYTVAPIKAIEESQHSAAEVRVQLETFRARKEYELHFVQRAATLSAAAVIGVKSWSDVLESFWLAQVAWHCSFFLSILALVSSSQERMLEKVAQSRDQSKPIRDALAMVLVLCQAGDVEKNKLETFKTSPSLIMFWQTPLMLMHYSWVTFLVGYELYLITPLIDHEVWTTGCTGAVIASVVGALFITQFLLNAFIARRTLERVTGGKRQ